MIRSQQIMRAARDAAIAERLMGGPAPVNPHRKDSRAHIWWNMGLRKAQAALGELMNVGG